MLEHAENPSVNDGGKSGLHVKQGQDGDEVGEKEGGVILGKKVHREDPPSRIKVKENPSAARGSRSVPRPDRG